MLDLHMTKDEHGLLRRRLFFYFLFFFLESFYSFHI